MYSHICICIYLIDYIAIYFQVKKKWSDLKLATKKRVAALRRSTTLTGGGCTDPERGAGGRADRERQSHHLSLSWIMR